MQAVGDAVVLDRFNIRDPAGGDFFVRGTVARRSAAGEITYFEPPRDLKKQRSGRWVPYKAAETAEAAEAEGADEAAGGGGAKKKRSRGANVDGDPAKKR